MTRGEIHDMRTLHMKSVAVFLAALGAVLALSACAPAAGDPPAKPAETLILHGNLTYRERIALPPGSTAEVTLADVSLADAPAPVLARQTIALQGRQVPVPFSLTLDRAQLKPRMRYSVQGRIQDSRGNLLWITDTVNPVDPVSPASDMGTLVLVRAKAPPQAATPPLKGTEWVVEDIGGAGIIDRSRVTIRFGDDGRLGGRGGCNSYGAPYALTATGIKIGPGASTQMACAPALMQQEMTFLRLLEQVQRFEIRPDGALVLTAGDGRRIVAHR
ncbi:META domain-containing protein [Vineibacter terrae]|uniref:META domain-containing protein n=2 Tax=Vineibacter terrae TaxID=2586908 RepID=A0A5C8PRZ4_9HYPH|nr:META domain-containing protein [Vineibacter terrae]